MAESLVPPLFEREDGSAPGPFYVIKDRCLICSLPTETAPVNIQYHQRSCTGCSTKMTTHCLVSRQPETPEELDRMIEVMAGSCVEAYRYCGSDPEILRCLIEAGCKEHCDALIRGRHGNWG